MSLWAIIPVKPLNRAKSRLADVLSPDQRNDLAERMFRQVLSIVVHAPQITGTLVISRDPKALAIARDYGAKTIQESNPSDLNPALHRATEVARAWRADAIFILPADLPFVAQEDLAEMIHLGQRDMSIVIASDHQRDGTNAMLIRPPGLIDYSYGPGSFDCHVLAAQQAGAQVYYYDSGRLMLDIDEAKDLEEYNQRVDAGHFELLTPFRPLSIKRNS